MDGDSLHQFLVLYSWFPLAVLLAIMLLIGRFYQKFSGENTYYWLYTVAAVLFGALFVRLAGIEIDTMDYIVDALSICSGTLLLFLSLLLYLRMMQNQEQ